MKRPQNTILIITAVKTVITWGAIFFLARFIPYYGGFPYKEILVEYVPALLRPLANFDGVHYILIARQGYTTYEQAFFPLFPFLIKYVGLAINHQYLIAGLAISAASYLVGMVLLLRICKKMLGARASWWCIALYLSFPTAFFFNTVYTESLFLLLVMLALVYQRNWIVGSLAGAAASLTRLTGVFLLFPALLGRRRHYLTVLAPIAGLVSYMAYLWKTTGDPLFFFSAQPAFGANRSTHLILLPQVYYRYLRILTTADYSIAYLVACLEVGLFTLMLAGAIGEAIVIARKRDETHRARLGLLLFSLTVLLLPTLTGTFSSVPRYCLFSFSSFIFFAQLRSSTLKAFLCIVFFALQLLMGTLFVQGYFVS